MKKIFYAATLLVSANCLAGFINPMNFDGSDAQKNAVIHYIQQKVKKAYCNSRVDMCNATTLRMMEKENMRAFKALTNAKDQGVMQRVIKDYCNSQVDMCDYVTIKMMYDNNLSAKNKTLTW